MDPPGILTRCFPEVFHKDPPIIVPIISVEVLPKTFGDSSINFAEIYPLQRNYPEIPPRFSQGVSPKQSLSNNSYKSHSRNSFEGFCRFFLRIRPEVYLKMYSGN